MAENKKMRGNYKGVLEIDILKNYQEDTKEIQCRTNIFLRSLQAHT